MINDELLSELPDILVERIQNANTYCLKVLARHIKKIGELTASDVNMIDEMRRAGVNIEKIIAELDKTDAKNAKDIAVLFEKTAEDSADNSKIYYKAAGVEFVPYSKNENLQKMVKSIEKMTLGKYLNMSQTRVVKLLDKSKKPVVLSLEEAYKEVIDQAVTNVSLGYQGYQSAMEDILKEFSKSGIRCVEYESSVTRRLDSAVRMNVLEGVRQVSQGVQDAVGEEFGADGKEISAHSYCAPDHEPYQGRQYTNEEYAKLEERLSYPNRGIGKLNCRHFTYSIIVGVSPPIYSEKELKEFEQKNAEGIEYEGKHYTMYEATQVQRKLETSVRYAYDDAETAKEAGLKNWEEEARKRVRVLTRKYKDFSDYAGLPYKKNRLKTYAVKSKSLTKDSKGDIINKKIISEVQDVHYVGKIKKDIYKNITSNIQTDEVIITDNRIQHIIERRGQQFYDNYREHFEEIVANPDYIFKDKRENTAIACKTFNDNSMSINLVIKLIVKGEKEEYKNSIITAIKESDKRFRQRLRNNVPVYKKLDNKE